jgi:hypothetical protein
MNKGHFLKHLMTDTDNETFDIGRAVVFFVVASMVFMQGWDVVVHATKFDAQAFGTGVSALLIGLGAYIFGDKKGLAAAPPVTPAAPVAPVASTPPVVASKNGAK